MSGTLNSVTLIGNLGADPDVRTTASGKMVATLSLATSRQWTDGQGQRQEKTAWHRVVVWGKQAELAQRFLTKGRKVCIQGEIEYRSWDDQQTGQKRYSTEIVASQMTFLDSGGGGADRGEQSRRGGGAPAQQSGPPQGADPEFFDDEPGSPVPF